jgi:hypothetical protein
MGGPTEKHPLSTVLIRWIARLWSIASILIFLLLCVGEGIHYTGPLQWLGFLFYPVGVSAGMMLAWRRECLGGGITAGSLAVFYVIHFATAGAFPKGWGWLVLAAPGFLFLYCCYRTRREGRMPADPTAGSVGMAG